MLLACLFHSANAAKADDIARIGVLAYRGTDVLDAKWSGLQRYLNERVDGWQFKLVPITLNSAETVLANSELDFLLTNPGHFVDLKHRFPLSAIASRQQLKSDGSYATEFGSAIIVRSDSEITHLQNTVDKRVAAIGPNAFGGFQTAWREFDDVGVDLFSDTAELSFVGFPMDQIIQQVIEGTADVGIVRSGLVEELEQNGTLTKGELRFLNASVNFTHPDRTSTRLYPEWPFAAANSTDPVLRDAVALALLMSANGNQARKSGMRDRWSAPLSYHTVEELAHAYKQKTQPTKPAYLGILQLGLSVAVFCALAIVLLRSRKRREPNETLEEQEPEAPSVVMTKREQEVLTLISEGQSTKEIARTLNISPKTVEFHRANLLKKFDARTSSQLVALAT